MKSRFIDAEFEYDGTQLRSLFGYLDHGLLGDSVVSWVGPCSISFEHMIDGEDLKAEATIAGGRMLHFIIEKFHAPLLAGVALQRLFAAITLEMIRTHSSVDGGRLRRSGDDLYVRLTDETEGKLSISIATVTPVSTLIHFAVNCTNDGTPVKTASLEDLGLSPKSFAEDLMSAFTTEFSSIEDATVKVRWAR